MRWFLAEADLLNVRLVFLFAAFVHLVITAVVTLSIDTTVDEDPKIRSYYYVRWKLLTCWFNILTLAYLPARIYVDWNTKRGEGNLCVKFLNHATDVLMTGLIMPTTVFSDVMFWSIYTINPGLLAPVKVFTYLPYWSQHSLHSVSLAVVLVDLLLTPRRRPSSLKMRLSLMSAFVLGYSAMVFYYLWRGEIIYTLLEHMTSIQLALFLLLALLIHLVIFQIQWFTIDLLWERKVKIEFVKNPND